MPLKRMDNILIVVDDLEAVKAFFMELGLRLEGEQTVEGPAVGRLIGLENVRATLAMMRTPDGQGIELDKFHTPAAIRFGPVDSPVKNPLYAQQDSPVAKKWPSDINPYHAPGDPKYPHVLTTYRLTEHHSGGTPTRSVAATAELQPEGFAEIPLELAQELGVATRDWVVLSTARGEVETRALVTSRLKPLEIDGQRIYQVGMPFHYGWEGFATGAPANILTSVVGDPNTSIHEGKALTCGLRKGRLAAPQGGEE